MKALTICVIGFGIVGGTIAAIMVSRHDRPAPPVANIDLDTQAHSSLDPTNQSPVAIGDPAPEPATVQPQPPQPVAAPKPPMAASANPPISHRMAKRAQAASAAPSVNGDKPIARQALSLVGADPTAEAIWENAINDPRTSEHDRQDLIEDLNEDGFQDPENPTTDELPLIESRLALIEQLAPDSMDDVNAAAFAEAYKDLNNMHIRLTGQ